MNTLQYFLSTLRPAPPPSPRASTSELPISASVAPGERQDASDVPVEVQMDETEAEERRQGVIQDDGEFAAEVERRQDEEGQARLPPHIGVIPPSRRPSWKGKARVAGDAAVLATEDPLRDGATVQTELERGEGVESSFVDEKVPVDQAYNGTVALRDPEKALPSLDTSTVSGKPHAASSSPAWPWMTRLARWWPFRLTTSIYVLVRRFLSLFGLPYSPRSGYNALLAPAFSTEHGASADDEKGKGGRTRFVTLALTLSQRSLPQTESRMLSPSPSPTPSPGIPRAPQPPPRLTPKTLVLDLDETLIHSTSRQSSSLVRRAPKGLKMRVVEVVLDGRSTVYTVYKRPWVDFFLRKVRRGSRLRHARVSSGTRADSEEIFCPPGLLLVHRRHLYRLATRVRRTRHRLARRRRWAWRDGRRAVVSGGTSARTVWFCFRLSKRS